MTTSRIAYATTRKLIDDAICKALDGKIAYGCQVHLRSSSAKCGEVKAEIELWTELDDFVENYKAGDAVVAALTSSVLCEGNDPATADHHLTFGVVEIFERSVAKEESRGWKRIIGISASGSIQRCR